MGARETAPSPGSHVRVLSLLFENGHLSSIYFSFFSTEKIPAEAQPELGSWGDGKGEDELSPEEIQMVMLFFAYALGFHPLARPLFRRRSRPCPDTKF